MPAIGHDHVMRCLRAAIEPHDCTGPGHQHRTAPRLRAEPVDDASLAGVAIAEVDDDDMVTGCAAAHSRMFPFPSGLSRSSSATDISAPRPEPIVASALDTAGPASEPTSSRSARPSLRLIASSPRPTVTAIVSV